MNLCKCGKKSDANSLHAIFSNLGGVFLRKKKKRSLVYMVKSNRHIKCRWIMISDHQNHVQLHKLYTQT